MGLFVKRLLADPVAVYEHRHVQRPSSAAAAFPSFAVARDCSFILARRDASPFRALDGIENSAHRVLSEGVGFLFCSRRRYREVRRQAAAVLRPASQKVNSPSGAFTRGGNAPPG